MQKQKLYNEILKQKGKVEWILDGDDNTKLFFQSFKMRKRKNRILSIFYEDNWCCCPEDVDKHPEDLLMNATSKLKVPASIEGVKQLTKLANSHNAVKLCKLIFNVNFIYNAVKQHLNHPGSMQ